MNSFKRYKHNPIIQPQEGVLWERDGAFNGCVAYDGDAYHMVYRAQSAPMYHKGNTMSISTIGYAKSTDGKTFHEHRQIVKPTEKWEEYGCEDPRITYLDGKFYIFYTALSEYPFNANGIKNAVAVTKDFETFEKHPVTHFNSKAMALFPEKVNGKYAVILTAHTDMPPAKIAIAYFDKEEDMWNRKLWESWYFDLNSHVIHLLRNSGDQIEIGAPPVKTDNGWLLIFSYITNYYSDDKVFSIEGALLDFENPHRVIERTCEAIFTPHAPYELEGQVPNIVFPSGALLHDDTLSLYYGGADTVTALATVSYTELKGQMEKCEIVRHEDDGKPAETFDRYDKNPIIEPRPELEWEALATFNPAAVYADDAVHILYRAMSRDNTSYVGYARATDGFSIDLRLDVPIYEPRAEFEQKKNPGGNSGCEDPRMTLLEGRYYMCYTAYDGVKPPRVALTSIDKEDFLKEKWRFSMPILISPPDVDDKDACLLEKRVGGKYVFFHRIGGTIWIDFVDDLKFGGAKWLGGKTILSAREDNWDNVKVGIASPPHETDQGWLLLYHGVSSPGNKYMVGAVLLDSEDPSKVIGRTDDPLFTPELQYEIEGVVPNVVFPCGSVVKDGNVLIYYGGADRVTGVASMKMEKILELLVKTE